MYAPRQCRKIAFYFIFLLALEISYVYIILDFRRNDKHRNDILTKMAKTYYQILNVDARAGFAELKRAAIRPNHKKTCSILWREKCATAGIMAA